MIIFPAIDIKGGRCVRLEQGLADKETVYGENPAERAALWESKGAQYIHLVDLDGAFEGVRKNREIIKSITSRVKVPVQLGGGIRTIDDIEDVLSMDVSRVILGTSVVQREGFAEEAIKKYGDKIAVSIDAKSGYAALEGWTKVTDIRAVKLAERLEDIGLKTLIYTDISKDGMLSGPNFEEMEIMKKSVNMDIIASGGVSTFGDIARLRNMGLYGAIIGKALYNGNLVLEEILR